MPNDARPFKAELFLARVHFGVLSLRPPLYFGLLFPLGRFLLSEKSFLEIVYRDSTGKLSGTNFLPFL